MANFVQKSTDQFDQQRMGSYRPTTLLIGEQYGTNPILFTPGDFTKIQVSTPELDGRARGYTTPELINVLSGSNGFHEQISPGTKLIEEMINSQHQQMSSYSTLTAEPSVYATVPSSDYFVRDRSVSSSIQDQDSSNSTSASSPPQREKKRERNRAAAQKCRTRKLNRIAELQKRVDELQNKNQNLTGLAESLRGDVIKLERQLDYHRNQGCTLGSGHYQQS